MNNPYVWFSLPIVIFNGDDNGVDYKIWFVLLVVHIYSAQQYLVDALVQLRVTAEYWACR